MEIKYIDYLCCPTCLGRLKQNRLSLICNHCQKFYPVKNGIPDFVNRLDKEVRLSESKWSRIYTVKQGDGNLEIEYDNYVKNHSSKDFYQLNNTKKIRNIVYLEIGCGPFHIGTSLAKKCKLIIGVDFSLPALLTAQKNLNRLGIKNYLLVRADVRKLPLTNNCVDLIYGGGVIEHFSDTQGCVNGLYRVLNTGGVSVNTVPFLNIASLTYRQLWGNIPNAPLIRQLAEYIHIKLLGGKHMVFGYEMSFTSGNLVAIHKKAGFSKVSVERLAVDLYFEYFPKIIRRPFIWLAQNSRLFWPMVKVIAHKK